MLHLLYIFAFTVLAVLSVANLVRNLISLGGEARRSATSPESDLPANRARPVPHPELLDTSGNVVNEPLLVMRSISLQDAREQLDALYEASSSSYDDSREDK
jgi:hypothetical protein